MREFEVLMRDSGMSGVFAVCGIFKQKAGWLVTMLYLSCDGSK